MIYILNLIKPVWIYIILLAAIALLTVKVNILNSKLHGCTIEAHAIAANLELQNEAVKKLAGEEKKAQQRYDVAEREAKKEASKSQKEALEIAQEKVPVKCEDVISWAVDKGKDFK